MKNNRDRDSRIGNLDLIFQDFNTQICIMCDFHGKTKPGLKTHMTLKHTFKLNSEENTQTQAALNEFYEKVNQNHATELM